MSMIKVNFFEADNGDCFLLKFDNNTTLLIDGGLKKSMKRNIFQIKQIIDKSLINTIMLTHVDKDHIGGIIELFEKHPYLIPKISMMIFNDSKSLKDFIPTSEIIPEIKISSTNSSLTSYPQSVTLEQLIEENDMSILSKITSVSEKFVINEEVKLTPLSPSIDSMKQYQSWIDKKRPPYTSAGKDYMYSIEELFNREFQPDDSVTNISSISMLLEYKDKKLLFLGDSIPSDVLSKLEILGYSEKNKLEVDVVKISHHGSRKNTSTELLQLIKCDKFLISANGAEHPDKECLARIIMTQKCPELIFNYDNIFSEIFTEKELKSEMFKISVTNEVTI